MTQQPQPWVFRYMEDPADKTAEALGHEAPLRPAVPVKLADRNTSPRVAALVDSGSERTLATPGLARAIGVDLSGAVRVNIGVGGAPRDVHFATVRIQLFADMVGGPHEPLDEWEAQVGFFTRWEPAWGVLLGGRGFFDRFTLTMHRAVPALAIDAYDEFDRRYGASYETVERRQPRFRE